MADASDRNAIRDIPLLYALVIPFTLIVIVTASLVGVISYFSGRSAVHEVSRRLHREIAGRIDEYLANILTVPHHIISNTVDCIQRGLLDPTDQQEMIEYFRRQVDRHPNITSVYFGNPEGGLADSGREAGGGEYQIVTEGFVKGPLLKYAEVDGRRRELLLRVSSFDATMRPWYVAAIARRGPVWSPVYTVSTGNELAVAASCPVYDAYHSLIGVVSADIFLSHISQFLSKMEIGKSGQAFVIEPASGRLIASSTVDQSDHEAISSANQALHNEEENNQLLKAARTVLAKNGIELGSLSEEKQLDFLSGDRPYFLLAAPLRGHDGLDWSILVAIPEADFMAEITSGAGETLLVVGSALLLAVMSGFLAVRAITRPLGKLNDAALLIAGGHDSNELPNSVSVRELHQLTRSFNVMSVNLHASITELRRENEERRQVESALRYSEERYRLLVDNAGQAICVAQDNMLCFLNPKVVELLGYDEDEIRKLPFADFIHPDDRAMVYQRYADRLAGKKVIDSYAFRVLRKSGTIRWVELKSVHIVWDNRPATLNLMNDITDRKHDEERIQAALREKEILLQEIHHRVKNNMQVVLSLLDLQAQQLEDPAMQRIYGEAQSRIRSISLVHEILYQSQNFAAVDMQAYAQEIVGEVSRLFTAADRDVACVVHAESVSVNVEQAVPCGLIINELLTNAFKHAFAPGTSGRVAIDLVQDDASILTLTVTDNGKGLLPAFDPRSVKSLGISLIIALVEGQLEGTWEMRGDDGVRWIIRWPVQELREGSDRA